TIQTQDESILDRNYLQQPVVVRRQTERERRQPPKSFVQHIHEARYLRPRRLSCERIRCCEFDNVARRTDHDLAFEWQLLGNRSAKSGFTDIFAHNKRADRTNVNDTKLRQLFRDERWLASICPTDVYRAKKY